MTATRCAFLVLLALCGGGCVSFSARAQVGPVADSGGHGGVSAMVMAGYGWAGKRSAAGWTAGVESDGGGGVRMATSADVVRLHGDEWGVRAGGHMVDGDASGPASMGFHAALLRPLRIRTRDGSYDDDTLLARDFVHLFFGIETRAGVRTGEPMADRRDLEVGAALTLEMLYKYDDAM